MTQIIAINQSNVLMMPLNKETTQDPTLLWCSIGANKYKGNFSTSSWQLCTPPNQTYDRTKRGWEHAPWQRYSATTWINHFFNNYPARPLNQTPHNKLAPSLWYFNPYNSTGGLNAALLRECSTPLNEKKIPWPTSLEGSVSFVSHICLHCFIVILCNTINEVFHNFLNLG